MGVTDWIKRALQIFYSLRWKSFVERI